MMSPLVHLHDKYVLERGSKYVEQNLPRNERKESETCTRDLDQLINLKYSDEYLELNCMNRFSIYKRS